MNVYSIPPLASALIFLSLGGMAFFKSRESRYAIFPFALHCLSTFWWQFSWFILFNLNDPRLIAFVVKAGYSGITFIPVTFFHFYTNYLDLRRNRKWVRAYYVIALILLALLWSTNLFIDGYFTFPWGSYPKASYLHPFFLLYLTIIALHCFTSLIAFGHRHGWSGIKANHVKYLAIALFVYCFSAADFIVNYGIPFYPPGFLALIVSLGVITFAMVKYRLMDIRVAVTRVGLALAIYAPVLGIPFYAAYLYGSNVWPTLLMFILATGGPLWYRYLQNKAENILLADQKRYQKILLQASEGMLEEHDLDRLMKLISYMIKRTVRLEFAASYLNDNDNKLFSLKGFRGLQQCFPVDSFAYGHPLIAYMENHRDPFTFDELPENVKESFRSPLDISLIVPSFSKDSLLGFLFLGAKQDGTLYTQDDINVFKTLSNQASLAVLNCIFTERAKKDQEVLLNEEKLALIGGMAAGVAHQFRNRLNHFVALSCEIQFAVEDYVRHTDTSGHTKEAADTLTGKVLDLARQVYDNSHRSTEVIQGILNLSQLQRESDGLSEFPLDSLVSEAALNIRIKHKIGDKGTFPLKMDESCSGLVYANKLRLYESLYNTIDNAYEAIREKADIYLKGAEKDAYVPGISVRLTNRDHMSVIAITDNGIGVREEHKKQIFAPMFTTKPSSKLSSSGIGAFFVKTVIEKYHKGRVHFESEYTRGSTFYIEIPRKSAYNS